MILPVSNIDNGNNNTVWDRKFWMKSWYNSKIFSNFDNFSGLILWTKTVSIFPDQSLLRPKCVYSSE